MSTVPDTAVPTVPTKAAIITVPVTEIHPSPTNPRKKIDKAELTELAASIEKHGILQPPVVRHRAKGTGYELIFGERRWLAAKDLGQPEIAVILQDMADAEVLEVQLIENLQRSDLHALEEAHGYNQLMRAPYSYDVAKIAERVGRSHAFVYDRLKLMSLTKEAQDIFRAGKITAGHAVILARLKPEDQARAMDLDTGGLWSEEMLLFAPDATPDKLDEEAMKAVTARELQGWVDENVRLQEDEPEMGHLFPKTEAALQAAAEVAEKVVQITHDYHVKPEAKDGPRIIGPQSWRRADKKTCDSSVLGIIVIGAGRGETFKVCIDKKSCTKHWGEEIRARKKIESTVAKSGTTGTDRHKLQEEKRREERQLEEETVARWSKARPAILDAVAAAVKKSAAGSDSPLGKLLLDHVRSAGDPARHVPAGRSAEDLVRHLAFRTICLNTRSFYNWKRSELTKTAKVLGVDIAKVIAQAAPVEKQTPASGSADKKKSSSKAKAKKK